MHRNKLNVVLCWHMHQPQYRCNDIYTRPWTWLHAIKDYTDMAAHIEAAPEARAVVNFSPHLWLVSPRKCRERSAGPVMPEGP